MGKNQDPVTLHKYMYAGNDPVYNIDPSGNSFLGSFGAASTIQTALIKATVFTTVIGLITTGVNDITKSAKGRRWSIWDIVARNALNTHLDTLINVTTKTKERDRNPNDEHHTIPIFICGALAQQTSSIERKQHGVLHTGLAAVQVAIESAENAADNFIQITRRRTDKIMSLSDTKVGRKVLANAIEGFYKAGGWWGVGSPSIGNVFPQEKREYINGKTSLPKSCKRK